MMADPHGSKLIAARLRAGALEQASGHPDADLLTAFAEGCLNQTERTTVLEHLAKCTVCRDVVYLAQPEEEAVQPVKAPAQVRWFAWKRLQWAALAASLSVVVAIALLVRTTPDRWSTTSSVADSRRASSATTPQPSDAVSESHASSYESSPAAQAAEKAENKSEAAKSLQSQERAKPDSTVAGRRRAFSRDEKDAFRFDASEGAGKVNDQEAEKHALGSRLEQKGGAVGGLVAASANGRASNDKNGVFDIRQQRAQGGPSANTNSGNINQNAYLYRDAQSYAANVPAPAPSAAAPVTANGGYNKLDQSPAAKSSAAAEEAAPRKTVARAVVPAEEARRKNLETIPAPPATQSKEETVAVAGQLQEPDRFGKAKAGTSGALSGSQTVQQAPIATAKKVDDLGVENRNTNRRELTGEVAPNSAITGWRVHHGRVQERLYGIWHNVVVGAPESLKANLGAVISATGAAAVPQPHFSRLAAVGANIWAAQAIGKDQSYIVVYHSHDNGLTWQSSILAGEAALNPNAQVAISFKDPKQGEVALSTGEKWQTSDGGAHWSLAK